MGRQEKLWTCPSCGRTLRYASAPGHLSRVDHRVAPGSQEYHELLDVGLRTAATRGQPAGDAEQFSRSHVQGQKAHVREEASIEATLEADAQETHVLTALGLGALGLWLLKRAGGS